MGLVRYIAGLLFIIAVPIALITTNVRIAVNEPRLYEYALDNYGGPARTGISREELLRASGELRAYFNNNEDELFVRVQQEGQPVRLFNERETAHLRDVKTLFQTSFRVQEASVIFALAYVVLVFIWAREGSLRALATQVLLAGVAGVVVIGAVGAIALAGFDAFWERFHIIAFDNELWRLDPATDRLIQMFPSTFWQDVSLWIGIATMAELAALSGLAGLYLGLTRRSSARYALAAGAQA